MFGFLTDVTRRDHGGVESKCGKFIATKPANDNGTKYKSRKRKRFDFESSITIRHKSELHGKICPRRRNEHKKSFNRNGFILDSANISGQSIDRKLVMNPNRKI